MPKYVEVGQDVIEFPDTMSDAEIEKVLASQYGSPTKTAEDTPEASKIAQEQPQKRSIWEEAGRQLGLTGRAAITAATEIPALLVDPIAAGINQIAGKQVILPASQAVQRGLTQVGFPEPENTLERAVQRGATAMAGVGGQAKLAQAAGSQFLAPLTKEIPQQIAAAGAAGAAAQATSERAQEAGYSPFANFAASLAAGSLAGMGAASAVRRGTQPRTPQVTMEQVKQEAGRAYTRVDNAGINVKPQPLLSTIDDIETNLVKSSNFNPVLDTHRPVKQVLDQMRQMVGSQRVSFTKLDQMRQAAVNLARESKEPATRRLAAQVVEGIDKKITALQPTDLITGKGAIKGALKDVKEARDAWKRVAKASVLEDALNIAEARGLAPNASEGELIRTQFKALAANKDKMRLFSKEEQAAIREVVSGKGLEKMLALAARFNPERSQLMTGVTIGGSFANPVLAGSVAAGGFAADKSLAAIQRRAAQNVISQILSGQIQAPPETVQAIARSVYEARAQDQQ